MGGGNGRRVKWKEGGKKGENGKKGGRFCNGGELAEGVLIGNVLNPCDQLWSQNGVSSRTPSGKCFAKRKKLMGKGGQKEDTRGPGRPLLAVFAIDFLHF